MALTQVSTGGIKDGQVHTADLADAQITAGKLHADALDRTYTLGADGSNHYTFTGEGLTGAVNDPTLYLTRGKTYRFVNGNSAGAHPFRIQTTVNGSAGTEYNTGVTNNGGAGGSTIIFEVPHAAPDVLYYQCTSHGAMGGIFYITGALPDGGVTEAKIASGAVTNGKLAADAVTTAKIANSAITNSKLGDDCVTGSRIADNAVATEHITDQAVTLAKLPHGTSSNDGKFLRANNGADPTFETVSGTTINNNADNRVITGSDTANTLNAESGVTIDGSNILTIQGSGQQQMTIGSTNGGIAAIILDGNSNGDGAGGDYSLIRHNSSGELEFYARDPSGAANYIFRTGSSEKVRFQAGGGISFNGDSAAANALDDYEEGTWTPVLMFYNIYTSSWQNCTMDTAGTIQHPKYTKIGRWVTASFNWDNFGINGSTKDYARITGLPFTTTAYGAVLAGYNNVFQYNQNQGGWLAHGATSIEFYRDGNSWNHWQSGGGRHLQVTVHYQSAA